MKVAILLGRGIEGCGVTRFALEQEKWFKKQKSIICEIFASDDKKWGRRNAQQHTIKTFENDRVKGLAKILDEEYDIVYYHSLAGRSNSEEYQNLWFEYLVKGVTKPLKIAFQHDHKLGSLVRNHKVWETMMYMDACFTHSLGSPFCKKLKEKGIKTPVDTFSVGFDFDSLAHVIRPVNRQLKRVSYFGRFAGFKDPERIVDMQPLLQQSGFFSELRGIERSIGSLPLFYNDTKDRENTYKTNIYEVNKKNPDPFLKSLTKTYIYGPYNRVEGLAELSASMFGADFFNLDSDSHSNNMEYSMAEIIAVGCIPLFDVNWAKNTRHINGELFNDLKSFAIFSDRDNFTKTIAEMEVLANDLEYRDKFRRNSFELAKEHCDSSKAFKDILNISLLVKKKTNYEDQLEIF